MGCVSRDQLESRIDNFVRLQGGDENVEDPEEYEDTGGDGFDALKNESNYSASKMFRSVRLIFYIYRSQR